MLPKLLELLIWVTNTIIMFKESMISRSDLTESVVVRVKEATLARERLRVGSKCLLNIERDQFKSLWIASIITTLTIGW